ncbi:MAG: hypothetical protein ACYC5O_02040, partial [Anaerolineae bacterium]
RGNHQRRRRHEFATVRTTALRLTVLATNGAPSARVYEVRAYLERPAAPAPEAEQAQQPTEEQQAQQPEMQPAEVQAEPHQ